jgi:hypothetical protein
MVNKLLQFFKRFDYPVSARSFALFRVLFALYSLILIYQLYVSYPLYFDHVPPFSTSLFPVKLILLLWGILNLFLLAGLFTRYIAIANYVLVVIMTAFFANSSISSFNDDLLRIGSFMIIFLPVSRQCSIDSLIGQLTRESEDKQTRYLYYLLFILVSLGLLYFGSGITKLFSPMWQKGLGLWTPAIMPHNKWNSFSFFVDQQWLMYGLNFLVISFEILFSFLLFHKHIHWLLAVIGIGFHIGIAFLFPFTYISIGPIIFYSLFLHDGFWNRLSQWLEAPVKHTIYYNAVSYSHQLAIRCIRWFDVRSKFVMEEHHGEFTFRDKSGWDALMLICSSAILLWPFTLLLRITTFRLLLEFIAETWLPGRFISAETPAGPKDFNRFSFFLFIVLLCGVQLLYLSYHSYTLIKADPNKTKTYKQQRIATQDLSTKPSNLARTLFGVNSRGLFLDHAFTGTKTVFALSYTLPDGKEQWLPIFDQNGYCQKLNRNLSWHKLTFRYFVYNALEPDTNGLKKFTIFWAKKKHISLDDLHMTVYRRRYLYPSEYEKGYLDKMLNLPWDTTAVIHWKDTVFHYDLLPADTLNRE